MIAKSLAGLDDDRLREMMEDLGNVFSDVVAAEVEAAKIRVVLDLTPDQHAVAEYVAGLTEHTLARDAAGFYVVPTPLFSIQRRLAALTAEAVV